MRKISPESQESPEDPNLAQLQLENPGDIAGDTNSILPDISPENTNQDRA